MPGRERADLDERLASLEGRVAELAEIVAQLAERQAAERGTPSIDAEAVLAQLFGDETVHHLKAARREDLLTMRSLIDRWLERLGRDGSAAAADPPPRRRESISLD